ncbi:MAG: hypothetical protein LBF61_11140 [Azoarcus sp.]|nr:hypothetical protein [Azoarcus sp.]
MPHGKDWIPTQERELVTMIATWQTKLTAQTSQQAYGWPAAECIATGIVPGQGL